MGRRMMHSMHNVAFQEGMSHDCGFDGFLFAECSKSRHRKSKSRSKSRSKPKRRSKHHRGRRNSTTSTIYDGPSVIESTVDTMSVVGRRR